MLSHLPLVFASPESLYFAFSMVCGVIAVARFRRVAIHHKAQICIATGAMLLAIAAGQPIFNRPAHGSVVVMVDLSPSTRGATFRDQSALRLRIHQLLGDLQYQLLAFSDRNQPLPASLIDLPCDQTIFAPPPADAVLLFSDGQFELPSYAPPTYPVIDPAMDHPLDASVTDLKPVGRQVLATVHNNGSSRSLRWSNATAESSSTTTGDFVQLATPILNQDVTASLSPGDLWPENDSLTLSPQPPLNQERWWIGPHAPSGWQTVNLPVDSADYLRPGVIVLSNISADAISSSQQQHLLQYVRDLGGSLIIVGGDRAFAAGHYEGTLLDDLSPLASSPPGPAMQWLLLVDSSGSMAGDGSVPSPWQLEVNAVTQLLPQLPGHDSVSIGSFAESLKWWSTGKSAVDTRSVPFPPANASPNGPTNLVAALSSVANTDDGSMPSQLVLMTDADADLPNPVELAAALNAKKIHLHLLAIGNGSALPALRSISSLTGGSVIQQLNPKQWVAAATLLLRSALPDRYQHRPVKISPSHVSISDWNQTWLKSTATELEKSSESPMLAKWQVGLGKVAAIAYPADASRVQSIADQIATASNDPRFKITWNTGLKLKVEVTAIDRDHFLNREPIHLEMLDPRIGDPTPAIIPLQQTAPGQYVSTIPAPRSSQLVTIRDGTKILKQFAIAGRYPPEFDAIGNNRQNLRTLAERTGGSVINPGPVQPIQFHWPVRQTPLLSEFAFAGFVMIGLGLIWNRR
jgi:hypothetical protein